MVSGLKSEMVVCNRELRLLRTEYKTLVGATISLETRQLLHFRGKFLLKSPLFQITPVTLSLEITNLFPSLEIVVGNGIEYDIGDEEIISPFEDEDNSQRD